MGLGTAHVLKSQADTAGFVPEIWSDEITATYKKSLVAANLVKKMNVTGKKGDNIHVPKPVRGSASAKAVSTQVTLIAESGSEVLIALDQHWEYSRLVEDLADKQANSSLRAFYTEDAGYAMARKIDEIVLAQFSKHNGGLGTAAYDKAYIGSDGSTLYTSGTPNMAAITDAAIRRTIQRLDDNDVPMDGRNFIIPPSSRNTLMGLARFTEQAFVGEQGGSNTIRTGRVGNVYGVEVFVTSLAATATGAARIAPMFHKDAVALCMQMRPRVQTQYKQEYLGDLLTADTIFGASELRDEAAVALAVVA